MDQWPPRDNGIETTTWRIDDLRVGDLLFGQRAGGPLAWLCDAADEPWRHVGSVIDDDGQLKVVEIRGNRFLLTTFDWFFAPERRYVEFGAARLRLGDACIATANAWMRSALGDGDEAEQVYAWDDLIMAGLIAASHRGLVAGHRDRVRAAIVAAARAAKERLEFDGQMSLTCSAFVQLAYDHAGGAASRCAIEHQRWRGEPVSWPARSPQVDELFEMSEAELTGYDDLSVLDVLLEAERVDRGTGTTRMRPGQLAELLYVLVHALGGYALGEAPRQLDMDSRWVTPGDLWRSPTVAERAIIVP